MAEFGCSEIVATLGLSLFVVSSALSPMVLAPLSKFYSRKPVYIASLLCFVIWIIPCAVARNIQTLLVARFFNGFARAAFLSVVGGTVGDLFSRSAISAHADLPQQSLPGSRIGTCGRGIHQLLCKLALDFLGALDLGWGSVAHDGRVRTGNLPSRSSV